MAQRKRKKKSMELVSLCVHVFEKDRESERKKSEKEGDNSLAFVRRLKI